MNESRGKMEVVTKLVMEYLSPKLDEIDAVFEKNQAKYKALLEADHNQIGSVLKYHLILESYLNEYFENNLPGVDIESANLSFYQKVQLIPKNDKMVQWLVPAILEINRVRNKFSHTLNGHTTLSNIPEIEKIIAITRKGKVYQSQLQKLSSFCASTSTFLSHKKDWVAEQFVLAFKYAEEKVESESNGKP